MRNLLALFQKILFAFIIVLSRILPRDLLLQHLFDISLEVGRLMVPLRINV
ncbi:hypothetical protein [Sphingobacterium siyangense]|uniref:hypothetical protein n=1 Tax=Sphingobacterium siyangense TaxID=459529 RepID=UPI003C710DAF